MNHPATGPARALALGAAFLGLLAPLSAATAAPVTFRVTGTVTAVDDTEGLVTARLGALPGLGDPMTVDYTFDSLAPDLGDGQYALQSWRMSIGATTIDLVPAELPGASGSGFIAVVNDGFDGETGQYLDLYWALATEECAQPSLACPTSVGSFRLLESAATPGDGLASGGLPLAPPDYALFDLATFNLFLRVEGDVSQDRVTAQVSSVAVVPAPPAFWLLATGILASLPHGWRRRG